MKPTAALIEPSSVVLAWSSPDPIGLAGRLRAWLGVTALPAGGGRLRATLQGGTILLRPALGDERLSIVRWPAVGFPGVGPAGGGGPPGPAPDVELVGVGWATVELERAAGRLGRLGFGEPVPDGILGARAAVAVLPDRPALVLLEPTREGRLAASLARFGEGPAVLYVAAGGRALAVVPGRPGVAGVGPFGRQAPFPSARPWGPHLVACQPARFRPSDAGGVPSST